MNSNIRLIARMDIKSDRLIKGVHLEGLRPIGDPQVFSNKYYESGIDELIYMDVVASLYGRNNLSEIVKRTAENVFIPITVGGGVRSVEDVSNLLRSGADKVAINTAAIARPSLITEVANEFGSQCVVLSVEAKRKSQGEWEAFTDNGREPTGKNVIEWIKQGIEMGAGEVLLTSIDQEGTRKGFDCDLVNTISSVVEVPVIASGGMGKNQDLVDVVQNGNADAVAMADILHYERSSIQEIRKYAHDAGLHVRKVA